jgi:GDPmannose 4,6-dehydratase
VAKVYAHWMTVNAREAYGLHASSGILFNHESPRRGVEFVTRKITRAAAAIATGKAKELRLGNLEARRDWGFAGDYVRAMWRMLQEEEPGDYVIATGETHSVKDVCAAAFDAVGLDWEEHVVVDEGLLRPADVQQLVGDATKARERLDWRPRVGFGELIRTMARGDLAAAEPAAG